MRPQDFVSSLKNGVDFHQSRGAGDDSIAATLVAPPGTFRGVGVRPKILASLGDGTNVYSITIRQAKRIIKQLTGEEHGR